MLLRRFAQHIVHPDRSSTRLETPEILGMQHATGAYQDRVDASNARYLSQNIHLANQYPDLIRRLDAAAGRYLENLDCDAQGMRNDGSFKNARFSNIGRQSAILHARKKELELLEAIDAKLGEPGR